MLTVIGEALVDIVRKPGQEAHAYPGGSPMNVAVGAARLGHETSFIGHFGNDEYGKSIQAHLDASLVAQPIAPSAEQTSTAQAYIGADGAAEYEFDIEWSLDDIAEQMQQVIDSSTALHTGSIATMLEPGAHVLIDALRRAREKALISYDPNCRPTIISDRNIAAEWVEKFIAVSALVKASDEDVEWLYPQRSLADTAHAWLREGAELVVITRGADGPIAFSERFPEGIERGAFKVEVADTVGAGDSLMAALIAALLDRDICGADARTKLAALGREDIELLLRFSATAAGITVSRPGANPPNRDELNAALAL